MSMTYKDAFTSWESEIKPLVIDHYSEDDDVALSESWNDYTDSLCKDGQLSDLQYNYCPAFDETMPDDDKEYILDAMGVGFSCLKISKRPDGLMSDMAGASHWQILIKRGKHEMTVFYSRGSAHTGMPDSSDVFNSLLMDTSDIDGADFEEWAYNLGFDADSRKAERIFKVCQETLLNLRLLFSESELDDLREMYSDY